ncbi:MAG: YraN family protein [Clostridia bacterium]|nr:YraN family protein [Clostridia bacterium]
MNKFEFGRIGEDITCKYLINNNYKIIEKNFYYNGGEIDIIAFDEEKNELVFIEVKTRANKNYGLPSESVDTNKLKHITKGIKYYLHINKLEDAFIRIDIIELFYKKNKFYINHIKQII